MGCVSVKRSSWVAGPSDSWSRGFDVAFTWRRSPVQIWPSPFQNILTVIFPVFSWEMVDLRGILVIVVIERQLIWGFRLIFWNASVDRVVRNMVFGVSTILSGYA